ncbi:helix-turn-helix transcriptional regulator [Dermacoccaceae bacterium W4C1]
MSTPESATARLGRLLTMVPWLVNRQGIDLAEAAAELGVSTEQVEADLMLLFLCGTPGHMPDDLIEAEWDSGRVYLGNAETIARPLRLNRDEALSLIVGLRTLLEVPGLGERDAVERALAKLTEATGELATSTDVVQVALDADLSAEVLSTARQALAGQPGQRRVHLRYLVASRDETTERDVDPMRVVNIGGHWYLEGWCHRADDQRLFRLDRVEQITVLDVDGTPPPQARPRDLDEALFQPAPDDLLVVLDLAPSASWVAEYYPMESVTETETGLQVQLRVGDRAWIRSLLLRLGSGASVVQPTELAEQVRADATEALSSYQPV